MRLRNPGVLIGYMWGHSAEEVAAGGREIDNALRDARGYLSAEQRYGIPRR